MRRTTLSVLSALAILLSGMIVPEAAAQSRRDKEQTYVLEKPYEVKKLVPPTGKKIKNVILMIGDGMCIRLMPSPIIRITFFIFFPVGGTSFLTS